MVAWIAQNPDNLQNKNKDTGYFNRKYIQEQEVRGSWMM
jgi:hypothetical protein